MDNLSKDELMTLWGCVRRRAESVGVDRSELIKLNKLLKKIERAEEEAKDD